MEKKTREMPPSEEVTDRISWCHVSLPKKKMSIPSAVRTIDSQTLPFTRIHSMPRSCSSCLRYADARGKNRNNGIKIPWIHEFPKVSLVISLTFPAFFFFGFVMDFPRAAEAVDHRPIAAEEEALRVQRHRGSSADHRSLGPRASHRGVNLRGICWVNS